MTDDVRYERLVRAQREQVFDAFTSPGGQLAFYGRDDPGWITQSDSEVRVGGVWTILFGPASDQLYRHQHVFKVIDRPRRLLLRQPRRAWTAAPCDLRPSSPSKNEAAGH